MATSAMGRTRNPEAGDGVERPPRRGRLVSRVELHLAASSPLFAMLAWRLAERFWWMLAFGLLATLGAMVIVLLLVVARRRREGDPFQLAKIVDLGDQVAGYVVSYLLPFLLPSDASTGEVWLTVAVLGVIGVVLVQSNQVHLNPLLYLFGYRVYAAIADDGQAYYLVARSDLSRQEGTLVCVEIMASLLVEQRGADDQRGQQPAG